jgi:putative ATP-binding cassette transporter
LDRWRDICIQAVRSAVVSQTSGYLAAVLPILLCAPKFLDGSMTLGQIMQAAAAFGVVQTAFNWLVDNYPRLADWSASARRVASLMISIDMLERTESGKGALRIRHSETDRAAVRLCNLSVTLDDNRLVVKDVDVTIARGECVIVVGQSGTGKSSLVRAIGGQWPWGKGEVQLQRGAKMCVVPQRPYIPLGTLLRAAAYPMPAEEVDREEVAKIMKAVGLGHLIDRLDEDSPWEQTLSGGEKQRLAFARLLIARPDIVVMDESTSALDPLSQKHLMELIHKRLRAATIIGVGHRPELESFYERKLVLESRYDGARLVRDVDLTRLAAPARRRDILVKFDRSLPASSGVSYQSAASARPSTSAIGR